jgi:NADH-quinone oxidoreductase subunit G
MSITTGRRTSLPWRPALRGKADATASMAEILSAPAILLIGNDPTEQHPLLAWQIRNNVRLHRARLYVINSKSIKLRRQATSFAEIPAGAEGKVAAFLSGADAAADVLSGSSMNKETWVALRDKLRGEQNLVIVFGSEVRGEDLSNLVKFGSGISGAKFVCLADYANSRGRLTWGCIPICCRDITQAAETASFIGNGVTFRRLLGWICRAWSTPEKRAS